VSIDVTVRGRVIPPDELSWRFSRSPGPGGQSVNTTESRVELSYDLAGSDALPPALKERALRALAGRMPGGVITVTASEHRSQLRNREAAAARMSGLLTEATAPPPRPASGVWPTSSAGPRSSACAGPPTSEPTGRPAARAVGQRQPKTALISARFRGFCQRGPI